MLSPRLPLLLGHRGSPRQAPENTIASFQAALDAGLDGIELDVRRLGDGTLVIHHDAALANGQPLPSLSHTEWPAELPTLLQALSWAADTSAFVNIELKFESVRGDDRVHRTLDAVRGFGLSQKVLVSSFMPTQLLTARNAAPNIQRGLLIHRRYPAALLGAVMHYTGSAALHPSAELIDAALMAQAKKRGWQVNAWTVNKQAEVQRLLALGVNGIISDVPEILTAERKADRQF